MPRDKDRRQYWGLDPLVVVRVDADLHLLGGEGVLAELQGLQFVVRLEIGPAPDPAVDDVGETFPVGNLQSSNIHYWLEYDWDLIELYSNLLLLTDMTRTEG